MVGTARKNRMVTVASQRTRGGIAVTRIACLAVLGVLAAGFSGLAADDFPPLGPEFSDDGAERSLEIRENLDWDLTRWHSGSESDWRRGPLLRGLGLDSIRRRFSAPGRLEDPVRVPSGSGVSSGESRFERVRRRLSDRYSNPETLRFMRGMPYSRVLMVFEETSDLIDRRHIHPLPYADRFRQGVMNLVLADSVTAFRAATGLRNRPGSRGIAALAGEWNRRAAGIANRSDCLAAMNGVMNDCYRELNLHPTYVGLEFVFASVEVLDEYSQFSPEAPGSRPSASLASHVVGIGVELREVDSRIVLVRVLPAGPAARAGLRTGDEIVALDGVICEGRSLAWVADRVSGVAGTALELRIRRNGSEAVVKMVRSRVKLSSVSDASLIDRERGVGYVRLSRFAADTAAELDAALWQLYRDGMKSLVVDVRGNPGGLLSAAIDVSNRFLPCGVIVSTRGRVDADQTRSVASADQTWRIPLVVLVDGESASASEIFAAAVQENRRGLVAGMPSYGKGTVQTHFRLRSVEGTLKLTTARFYSPSGRAMAGEGVKPDVSITGDVRFPAAEDRMLQRSVQLAASGLVAEMARRGPQCMDPMGVLIGSSP